MISTTARLSALAFLSLTALTACASSSSDDGEIAIADPWVKSTEEGMTAAFGELTNGTSETIVVVSASSDAASMIELHETVTDDGGTAMMQQKDGGFTIEPGESLMLEPGGNHIMLMGVAEPIAAGDDVDFTLELEGGSTFEFTAVAKEFAGANEEYDGDHGDMEMDMDADEHGDHDH